MLLIQLVDKRIDELCDKFAVTRYKIAKKAGMNTSTLSEIKNSQTIKLETILIICDALEITLKEFFESSLFDRINIDLL